MADAKQTGRPRVYRNAGFLYVCTAAAGLGRRYVRGCEVEYSEWAEVHAICSLTVLSTVGEKAEGKTQQLARW